MRRRSTLLVLACAALLALSLGLAACGGDDDDSAAGTTTEASTAATATAPATPIPDTTATTATTPSTSGGAAAAPLALAADPTGQLKFEETTLTASSGGDISIKLTNDSPVPHNVAVEGPSGDIGPSDTIQGGADTTLDVGNLPAGTYTYYCEVPGHRQAGMEGTLTVK